MSKNSKIVMWVVIVIVILILAWLFLGMSPTSPVPTQEVNPNAPVSQIPVTSQTSAVANSGGLTTATSDSSNAALNADMSSIDAQQTGLGSDSANIDQSMSAKNSVQ